SRTSVDGDATQARQRRDCRSRNLGFAIGIIVTRLGALSQDVANRSSRAHLKGENIGRSLDGVSRLLQNIGRRARCVVSRNQERLPQACTQAPSRRQSQQQRSRTSLQG